MKWSDEYATGLDQIDRQHQMLFRMSEDFRASLDEGSGARAYASMLESLQAYAHGHFGVEEHCMFQYQCPAAEANHRAHGQFMDRLEGFRDRYRTRGFNRPDAYELVEFVDQWLANHIARIDIQLKHCVKP